MRTNWKNRWNIDISIVNNKNVKKWQKSENKEYNFVWNDSNSTKAMERRYLHEIVLSLLTETVKTEIVKN